MNEKEYLDRLFNNMKKGSSREDVEDLYEILMDECVDLDVLLDRLKKTPVTFYLSQNCLFMTTPVGEWYIPLYKKEIILYHSNYSICGIAGVKFNSAWHKQKLFEQTLQCAINTVMTHDYEKRSK